MNFYISKFRYKLAFACLAGIIIMIVNGIILKIQLYQLFADYGIVFAVLLLMSVYLWYPAFQYVSQDSKKLWAQWGDVGEQKKEAFEEVEFDRLYRKTRYALTKEPNKGYRTMTTLKSCNCVEFRKHHKPCKHMCKLADELGLYKFRK